MSLIYDSMDHLKISPESGVSYIALRNIYTKLLSNDMQMTQSGIRPNVWERKWYNDDSIPGYSKGAAVWVNTEDIDNFVKVKEEDIINYASFDLQLKAELEALSAESKTTERLAICKQIVLGTNGRKSLYYLGDISKPVQVKVSKIDNNKFEPRDENSQYWDDFFVRYDYDEVTDKIDQMCLSGIQVYMQNHIKEYHLPGVFTNGDELQQTFARNDMSNISPKQQFNSHYWYKEQQTGFDQVKCFYSQTNDDGTSRWFRLWTSGKLEHGGVISLTQIHDGDSFDNGIYTVNLKWEYDGRTAPVYDYPSDGFSRLYDNVRSVQTQYGNVTLKSGVMGKKYRYHVNTTPINTTGQTPYDTYVGSSVYDSVQTCFMDNDKFGIIVSNNDVKKISYSVSGYSSVSRSY